MAFLRQPTAALLLAVSLGWAATASAQQPPPPGYPPPPHGPPPPGHFPPGYGPPPGAFPPGYPPPGYGPAGAAPGYHYGPPPSYFVPGWGPYRPAELPHRDGAPIPPGYVESARAHRGLVLSGAIVLGSAYLISLLAAGTFISESERGFEPLVIPAAGPFITLGTADVDVGEEDERVAGFLLIVDGIAQTAGLGMLIIGLAVDQKVLRRQDVAAQPSLVPDVEVGPRSASATWTF